MIFNLDNVSEIADALGNGELIRPARIRIELMRAYDAGLEKAWGVAKDEETLVRIADERKAVRKAIFEETKRVGFMEQKYYRDWLFESGGVHLDL